MYIEKEQDKSAGKIRSVVEVMDAELRKEGWTQDQLNENRQLADRYEELLAAGYTDAQIETAWNGKSPQEILAGANKVASITGQSKDEEIEVSPDRLTQKLDALHEYQIDALITSFIKKGVNPWKAVPRSPLGDKINAFVRWAIEAEVLEEAERRAQS